MSMLHKFTLDNGLRVVVEEDFSTPLVVVNVLYNVGSRDEQPEKTGFAHLFEHFMFEGSVNIEEFDAPLEFAAGESNAFTTSDLTNYYEILPACNIDTALWLESDRMLSLAFDKESLETQKRVVCEEFKEHYINKPYGDVWHKLSALAYKKHPYRWPTIGMELSHVENASMVDVKSFFQSFYLPNNAVLTVCGGISKKDAEAKVRKWFADVPKGKEHVRSLEREETQSEVRYETVKADVPSNSIYKAYKMSNRLSKEYYALDLLRDAVATSETAILYLDLVKEKRWLSSVSCYLSETLDDGLFVIEGKLMDNVKMEDVDAAIQQNLGKLITQIDDAMLEKLKNKFETYWRFSDTNLMNRAFNLAFFELIANAEDAFEEVNKINEVSVAFAKQSAAEVFQPNKCNTLFYFKKEETQKV
jgi:predicted Zn-dependent peptidase